jgi:hypothetical protein
MVLSEKNMDRMKGIRKMNEFMKEMFVDVPTMLPSMTYFFTKYQPKLATRICEQLTTLRDEFTEEDKFDQSYVAMVEDLIRKTIPTAIVIDPLLSDPKSLTAAEILNYLESVVPCRDPNKMFKTFVMPDSASNLASQWRILQRQTSLALQRHDLRFISKPLHEMQILHKLRLEEYSPFFTDSIKQLETYALSQWETGKQLFHSCLFSRTLCEDHNLFRAYEIFGRVLVIHTLLCELSSESLYDFSKLFHNLVFDSLNKLATVKDFLDGSAGMCLQTLLQVHSTIQQFFYFIDDSTAQLQLHPVFLQSNISETFLEHVRSYYTNLLLKLQDLISRIVGTINNPQQSSFDPNVLIQSLRALEELTQMVHKHCPNSNIEELKTSMFTNFFSQLESDVCLYSSQLYPKMNQDYKATVAQIVQFSSYLSALKISSELTTLLPDPDRIGLIEGKWIQKSSKSLSQLCVDCSPSSTKMPLLDLDRMSYYLSYIKYVSKNGLFPEISLQSFDSLNQLLQLNLRERLNDFDEGIAALCRGELSPDHLELVSLKETLDYLHRAELIFSHSKISMFSEAISSLEGVVTRKIATMRVFEIEHLENHSVQGSDLIAYLRLSDNLKMILENFPTFTLHRTLRDETMFGVWYSQKCSPQSRRFVNSSIHCDISACWIFVSVSPD